MDVISAISDRRAIKQFKDPVIALFVAIGKGTREAWPHGGQLPLSEIVIQNSFSRG